MPGGIERLTERIDFLEAQFRHLFHKLLLDRGNPVHPLVVLQLFGQMPEGALEVVDGGEELRESARQCKPADVLPLTLQALLRILQIRLRATGNIFQPISLLFEYGALCTKFGNFR